MAGILAGIKLLESGRRNFLIYEKADRIGGTWRENTYPGLTCDVPSHHYTYSFERNPEWTRQLPPGPEIQAYFERVCAKYDLFRYIRFGEEVEQAHFEQGHWTLLMKGGTETKVDVVIAATGVLHHPNMPQIDGMGSFRGDLFHSSSWDHSIELSDKRIGIIGNGSTGVQIVAALSGRVQHVSHFQRTAQWIMPVKNGFYSEEDKARFRADPAAITEVMETSKYRAGVEGYSQVITGQDSEGARYFRDACLHNLESNVHNPSLREQLRPDHEPLCKRLIFSPDYYAAIQLPGASLVTEGIEHVEEGGIRTADGVLHELDIIVFASGYHADAFMRPMQVWGRDGVSLADFWMRRPRAYLAISMPDFPNFFMLNGPNGPVGNFSLIEIAEHQWCYISQLLARLEQGDCLEIAPSQSRFKEFEAERIAAAKTTIWYTGGCKSWYLDADGIPASWPWSFERFVREMSEPDWRAFGLDEPSTREGQRVE
ncbi:MAG: NAD(P)/FAD-dependent oxidoreductase [Halioglobus sp.]|nr:NAD(P)/FAD-dependent oxidoreductase [Halioglobus sp.]